MSSAIPSPDAFKEELQNAVNERHQADNPLIDKIAAGEARPETITGAITEIWYWISNLLPEAFYNICARAPQDVIDMEVENLAEETDPDNPHIDLIVRFAEACGVSRGDLATGRGLPTTEAWLNWGLTTTRDQSWIAGLAGLHVASEAQEPKLISKILPALRETYEYSEHDLEFWWLHAEADVEHGGRAVDILAKHCDTRDKQELAIHWAREGARMKYLFWDGINVHYEIGYRLQ